MNAAQGNLLVFAQITDLLNALDQGPYTQALPVLSGSSIGQHLRHILEFYVCLFEGSHRGVVDYSSRKRDEAISENPANALVLMVQLSAFLAEADENKLLRIKPDYSADEEQTDDAAYTSSLGRELQYAYDHAVHHLAMIRIGLKLYFPEVPEPAHLGVAPSTIRFQKNNTQQQRARNGGSPNNYFG